MSWRDAEGGEHERRFGRPGGDWQGMRPTIDNPMTWSVPLFRAAGIDVRLHVVFLIFVVVRLTQAMLPSSPRDFMLVAMEMAALFVVVLLHEFGHCFGCRSTGGSANEILMWPLGGLAYCQPPQRWKAHLITVLAGPAVNVVIFVLLCPVLGLLTGTWLGIALPNPLHVPAFGLQLGDGTQPWWLLVLFAVHDISFILLLFNLLPMFPLDGGRVVQACLWPRVGYGASMRYAVYAGYVGAIALGIFGAVINEWMLVGIAVFGGVTCYITLKQLQFTEGMLGVEDEYGLFAEDEPEAGPSRAERARLKAEQAAEAEREEVDRILAKIAGSGLESLTSRERRTLKRATDRSQGG